MPKEIPNIITRSELAELTPAQQQMFRERNGTVTEDPDYAERVEAAQTEEAARVKALAERAAANAIQAAAAAALPK